MNVLVVLSLTLVGLLGAAVVLTEAPERQAVTLSVFGLALAILFVVLGAPDVALSQLAIGTAVVPLMVMLTVRRISKDRGEASREEEGE